MFFLTFSSTFYSLYRWIEVDKILDVRDEEVTEVVDEHPPPVTAGTCTTQTYTETHTYTYTYTYTHTHIHTYTYTYTYKYTYTYAHTSIHTRICIYMHGLIKSLVNKNTHTSALYLAQVSSTTYLFPTEPPRS